MDVTGQDAGLELLDRTSRFLRKLVWMRSAGETSGEEYERVLRQATRVTKQSAALLDEIAANRTQQRND